MKRLGFIESQRSCNLAKRVVAHGRDRVILELEKKRLAFRRGRLVARSHRYLHERKSANISIVYNIDIFLSNTFTDRPVRSRWLSRIAVCVDRLEVRSGNRAALRLKEGLAQPSASGHAWGLVHVGYFETTASKALGFVFAMASSVRA